MVILLNYLPWIILFLGAFITYKVFKAPASPKRNNRVAFVISATIGSMIVFQGLSNGYIPKTRSSEVKIPSPEFATTEAVMQDKLRSPKLTDEERTKRFNDQTDWRKRNTEETAAPAP